jgi:hypothetical protein
MSRNGVVSLPLEPLLQWRTKESITNMIAHTEDKNLERNFMRVIQNGVISPRFADKLCCMLGGHVEMIWHQTYPVPPTVEEKRELRSEKAANKRAIISTLTNVG